MSVSPDSSSVRRARAAAESEAAFWREHYGDYLTTYPDQFVAVSKERGRVVAADPDLDRLIALVEERGPGLEHVWVRYIAATPIRLAL